jgi:mannose-6-phosphate isomerase
LLVKYLFTSEKLSIQVHPDDAGARAAGHKRGKEEAWVILGAEPDATIAIGMQEAMTGEALRAAALDGSIEEKMRWWPAKEGDFFYSPAGTVHAIGPGLSLIEVQQNVDLTYRLYDYGRPRELHLEEGIAAARPEPYEPPANPYEAQAGRTILASGRAFVLEEWTGLEARLEASSERPVWLVPVKGGARADGTRLDPQSVWSADSPIFVACEADSELLVAYPGPDPLSVSA